jgi:flagellar M-ring protein FliF
MDFLNRTFAQVRDLFRSMTPGARITAALLLVVVVISLTYLFTYQVSGQDEYLLGGVPLSPGQFQTIEGALGKEGLSYTIEGSRIRIPSGQQAKYMGVLADANALPPQWGQAMGDAIKGESVFISADSRKERYNHAKSAELRLWVREMKNIEDAAVIFDCKAEGGFRSRTLNTASVNIAPVPGQELTTEQAAAIRNLVAGAIAGMKPDNVTVTDIKNNRSFHGGLDGGDGNMGDRYGSLKHSYEREWKDKILNVLAHVPGVTVEPNVELAQVARHTTRTVTPSPKGTATRTMEKQVDHTREGAGPQGQPGFKANQPNALPAAAGKGSSDTESQSETVEEILVGGKEELTEMPGMTPTRVTVAIGVPNSYFQNIWLQQHPTPPGEEPKKPAANDLTAIQTQAIENIQKTVANLLPTVQGVANTTDLVQVTAFPDPQQPGIPEPPMTETVLVWLQQYWSTLGMIGLAAFSLLMLRSMLRAAPIETPSLRIKSAVVSSGGSSSNPSPSAAVEERNEDDNNTSAPNRRLSRFSGNRASLGDELSDLVRDDADAAANILRTWIGTPVIKT